MRPLSLRRLVLFTVCMLGGALLFFFPSPLSELGAILILAGVFIQVNRAELGQRVEIGGHQWVNLVAVVVVFLALAYYVSPDLLPEPIGNACDWIFKFLLLACAVWLVIPRWQDWLDARGHSSSEPNPHSP